MDQLCDAGNLIAAFGPERFDVAISTELLEHVKDWKRVLHNLKGVFKRGGLLVLTTRSPGFPRHNFPADYWRFTYDDMTVIFSDFTIERLQDDPGQNGRRSARESQSISMKRICRMPRFFSMERTTRASTTWSQETSGSPAGKACGPRSFGKREGAVQFCDRLNQVIGWPCFGVVEARFITDTTYNVRFLQ